MTWLLDTNVVSELARAKPDVRVIGWLQDHKVADLWTSIVTIAELRFGIESTPDVIRRLDLTEWLHLSVLPRFAERIIPVTESILIQWLAIADRCAAQGKTLPQADALIAATAANRSLKICSRDTGPYFAAGIPVLNPWTGERFNGA